MSKPSPETKKHKEDKIPPYIRMLRYVLTLPGLSVGAKALWCTLNAHAGLEPRRCSRGMACLQCWISKSKHSLKRWIQELQECGLITDITKDPAQMGRSVYWLATSPPGGWKETSSDTKDGGVSNDTTLIALNNINGGYKWTPPCPRIPSKSYMQHYSKNKEIDEDRPY